MRKQGCTHSRGAYVILANDDDRASLHAQRDFFLSQFKLRRRTQVTETKLLLLTSSANRSKGALPFAL
eukprot:3202559-Amphidinium_carterae.1